MATTILCTVTNLTVKYPHGIQADDATQAALTGLVLDKAADEPAARAAQLTVVVPGDLRTEFPEGSEVSVTLAAAAAREAGAKPGAEAGHEGGVTTKTVTASVSHTQAKPAR